MYTTYQQQCRPIYRGVQGVHQKLKWVIYSGSQEQGKEREGSCANILKFLWYRKLNQTIYPAQLSKM